MNKQQLDNWKINVFFSLKNISDLEWQKLAWTASHPVDASSFVEVINVLYDDNYFEEYIDYVKNNESNKRQLHQMFIELDRMIDGYKEEDKSAKEILDDLNWINITKVAKKIIETWITN